MKTENQTNPEIFGGSLIKVRRLKITERQLECLSWVQEGKSASDIGAIMGISSRTVEGHLLKLCDHLGVRTRVQAVLRARDLGLLDRPGP